ncbi:coiled-coil domain-containing protein 115 [Anabrus simplex]|uniref:coiled-coil domain-containing protein 115 n=1 Tax=Anabrus simplex TaxID=316456 RepID=UPI0034DCC6EF
MGKQLNEIYKEMDELSLKILQLMEQHIRSKVRLEELMKTGFLDMAKARYIMGNNNVSSLQLPTECSEEFLPQYTVTAFVESTLGHALYKLNNMSLNDVEPSIERTLVKKRKGKMDEVVSISTDMQEDEESAKIIDPLKWFGVLVPQNLRRAQTCFRTVLQLVVEIATIQSELVFCQQKYKELLQCKSSLLAET